MAGGGTALIDILPALENIKMDDPDAQVGVNIIKKALEEPVRQIAYNAGVEGSIVVEKVKEAGVGVGFNALTNKYEDMIAAGIVDPAKVTRSALQNAASIAGMVLTTESLIADIPEEKNNNMPGGMPPGGMM